MHVPNMKIIMSLLKDMLMRRRSDLIAPVKRM